MIILGTTGTIFGTSTKVQKCLNQCFAQLRSWKSVSSKTAVDPSSRFCEFETLFQHWRCAKHWFKNLKILVFIWVQNELGHTVCSYILFCFSGLSKGHQQFTWEEGKIFSAKLVCFENFLALNCLPVESSQEVLLNWEKMFNFEA